MDNEGRPIDLDELLDTPVTPIDAPLAPEVRLQELPWDKLPWEHFQKLCARLLVRQPRLKIEQAYEHGRKGTGQGGIDIFAIRTGAQKLVVAECKQIKKVTPTSLHKIVDAYKQGKWFSKTDTLIVCFSVLPEKHEEFDHVFVDLRTELNRLGKELIVWNPEMLNKLMKKHSDLVADFFGAKVAEQFAIPDLSMALPGEVNFRSDYSSELGTGHVVEEDVSVRLEGFLPGVISYGSCGISFTQAGVRAATFAMNADRIRKELLDGMGTELSPKTRKFIVSKGDSTAVVQFYDGGVRFKVENESLRCLAKVGDRFGRRYLDALEKLDEVLKASRFPRLASVNPLNVVIASIDGKLWKIVVNFANTHAKEAGAGPWNIFLPHSEWLIAWVKHPHERFDIGPHATIIPNRNIESFDEFPWHWRCSHELCLTWSPKFDYERREDEYGSRGIWDAQFTHDWFINEALPEAARWFERQHRTKRISILQRIMHPTKGTVLDELADVENLYQSAAKPLCSSVRELTTPKQLSAICRNLQSHFHCRRRNSALPPDIDLQILEAATSLVDKSNCESLNNYGRLDLDASDSERARRAARRPKAESENRLFSNESIDNALRKLVAAVENSDQPKQSELYLVHSAVEPLQKIMSDDRLIDAYT